MDHRADIVVAAQRLLPKHWLSRQIARLAESRVAWLKNLLIKRAIFAFDIDLEEAERSRIEDYHSFNDFFTRALRDGARPIDPVAEAIVSPADGTISQIGSLEDERILQAKDSDYSAAQLIGDQQQAKSYVNGSFATIYLSPSDYHRVHIPCAGKLLSTRYIPGDLFSVNDLTTQALPGLFSSNERLVCEFESPSTGSFCVIFVGAMLVAGIETLWGGLEQPGVTNVRVQRYDSTTYDFSKGDELGRFKFGSRRLCSFKQTVAVGWKLPKRAMESASASASLRSQPSLQQRANHRNHVMNNGVPHR
jgi:phosphatidylserine decarboxylase